MSSFATTGSPRGRFLRSIGARAITDAVGDALGNVLLALITFTWTRGLPIALAILVSPLACRDALESSLQLEARPPETASIPPPAPDPRVVVTDPIPCTDGRGNSATFRAVLFSRAYSWRLGESSVDLGEPDRDFLEVLDSPGLSEYVTAAPEVVVVGTASCEGYPERREQEIALAERRARRLHRWIERVRRPHHAGERTSSVYALNLGIYTGPCTERDTWRQRRILLFSIHRDGDGPELVECLAGALERTDELRYLATRYDPGFGPDAELF